MARGVRRRGPRPPGRRQRRVLTGGRVTAEDAYAYAKFARVSLGTNDIDFRSRPHSAEEADFLASRVALSMDVTYDDLERASVVVLAGLEPEDEAATIFLRLRKASKGSTKVVSLAPFTTRGLGKMKGRLSRPPRATRRRRCAPWPRTAPPPSTPAASSSSASGSRSTTAP